MAKKKTTKPQKPRQTHTAITFEKLEAKWKGTGLEDRRNLRPRSAAVGFALQDDPISGGTVGIYWFKSWEDLVGWAAWPARDAWEGGGEEAELKLRVDKLLKADWRKSNKAVLTLLDDVVGGYPQVVWVGDFNALTSGRDWFSKDRRESFLDHTFGDDDKKAPSLRTEAGLKAYAAFLSMQYDLIGTV